MAGTMKAAVIREFGAPLVIEDMPVPEPGPGQVVVRIAATGVCHTDLHVADGDWKVKPELPLIPGHEGVGTVAAAGAGVATVKEGDRVGVPWLYSACGHCEHCLGGWETLCNGQRNTGYSVNGGYAEYALAEADFVARLPDELDFAPASPLLCAGLTVYKGLKQTDTKPGDWIAVVGVGGLGHLAVQYAKAMGRHVVAVDVSASSLDLASDLGADLVVDVIADDPVRQVRKAVGGVHGALITASSNAAFTQGLRMLRKRGTAVLHGLPPGDFPVPIMEMVLQGKTVRGSIVGTRLDLIECLTFAAEGKVAATVETQPLEAVNEVLGRLRDGTIDGRVVLET